MVPSEATGGHQNWGREVIVARRRSPTAPGSRPSFFDLDFPFADSSNVEDDFDFNTSIGPGDTSWLFFIEGTMNAESLFASEEEAKRPTLVRL
jgi:hypothetical protein